VKASLSLAHTYHQLLETILVDLIGRERVDIFTSFRFLSHQLYKKRNNYNYTLLSICVETFESKGEKEGEEEEEKKRRTYV
jgi:hypothetical protein